MQLCAEARCFRFVPVAVGGTIAEYEVPEPDMEKVGKR